MKKRARILLISSVLLMSISCKKGDTGPQGLQGERGAQGEQGVTGLKGADGSIILSGADVPAEALGKNGDYYFRTGTNVLYGPKTTSGWGAGVSLKGSNGTNGANGTNGTKILSGIDLPGVNVGVVGDFYFRTSTSVFYGPKTASGWDTGVDLKGTANVIYSGWLKATNYKDSIIDGTTVNVAHIAAPKLTQTIRSSSVILVYLDYGGGVYPLPYTSRASGRMSTISYHLKPNEILIYRMPFDGGALINLSTSISYRYVIVPGGIIASLKRRNINLDDPKVVSETLKEFE